MRVCPHCQSSIDHLRSNAKFCGKYCKDEFRNQSKREVKAATAETLTCARQGCKETFTSGNGRIYCCLDCNEKAQNQKRNAAIRKIQKELTTHLFLIRHDGKAAIAFIEKLINSNDAKINRLFGANYLYAPERQVFDMRTGRRDLNRSQKIRYNRHLRKIARSLINNMFHDNNSKNRTIVEICDHYCYAIYRISLKKYRSLKDREKVVVRVMDETHNELIEFGLPDCLMIFDPYSGGSVKTQKSIQFARTKARPVGYQKMLRGAETIAANDWDMGLVA